MRRAVMTLKRGATLILATAVTAISLSGCGYASFDDYLKALGIKDPMEYNDDIFEATSVGDVATAPEEVSAEQAEQEAEEISFDIGTIESSEPDAAALATSQGEPADIALEADYRNASEADLDEDMKAARVAIGLTDEGIAALKKQQQGLYAYEHLTDAGKTLYVEMLTVMNTLSKDIIVSTTSDDAVEMVFDYIMADHPEIFYVDGYQYTNYSVGDTITKISFTGNYLYDAKEVERRQSRINEAVHKCLANAPSSEDDYYLIKYVYEYLIANTEYDINAADNQNICSVFINGRSVCNGYAKAAQYLLNKMGVGCTLVTGTVNTKNNKDIRHAWNLVLCNDIYYYLDVTWGDASYQTVSGESADAMRLPEVNYDYLNVTTDEIMHNHKISDTVRMPVCNSMADNYYVREDEYFTSSEMALVGDLFDRRYKDGSRNVTIKCASNSVYDSLFEELITNRRVFEFLQGDTSQVSYTTFEDTRTIIFWL